MTKPWMTRPTITGDGFKICPSTEKKRIPTGEYMQKRSNSTQEGGFILKRSVYFDTIIIKKTKVIHWMTWPQVKVSVIARCLRCVIRSEAPVIKSRRASMIRRGSFPPPGVAEALLDDFPGRITTTRTMQSKQSIVRSLCNSESSEPYFPIRVP